MNNDLEKFSEERLKEIANFAMAGAIEVVELARIALSAKQAKPVYQIEDADGWHDCEKEEYLSLIKSQGIPDVYCRVLFTTPQPAHTEQVITDNVRDALEKALNAMQFMDDTLNNLDAVCAEDVEHVTPAFEAIRKLLAATPKPESEL
jgi:hypothetical protein